MICHRHRFRKALRLVVDASDPDRVDIAQIVLGLWMDERIAVDLRRGSQEEPCSLRPRQPERLVRTERVDLQDLDRLGREVDRTGRRCEMKDEVYGTVDIEIVGDVVVYKPE